MATWLKQGTAVNVMMGPFVDSVDGNTVEGALSITQSDQRLSKNGGAFAQKNAAQTLAHDGFGWYAVALDATDTGTLGQLIVAIHEAGALPVWREFMVVPANVYDSMIAGTAFLKADAKDSVFDGVVENGKTFVQVVRGMVAAMLGKSSGLSGTTAVYRDNADAKNRISATVDEHGNRSAVTLDLS